MTNFNHRSTLCKLLTDLLATRPTSPQEVVVIEFGKRHDTTDTTDFCPRQLVTDLSFTMQTCCGLVTGKPSIFNVKFQLLLHKVKFYKRLFLKSGLLHDVFWIYFLTDVDDSCCRTVFSSLNTAIKYPPSLLEAEYRATSQCLCRTSVLPRWTSLLSSSLAFVQVSARTHWGSLQRSPRPQALAQTPSWI